MKKIIKKAKTNNIDVTHFDYAGAIMSNKINILNIIKESKCSLILGVLLYFFVFSASGVWASNPTQACSPEMTMCKIGYQQSPESLYPNSRINNIQNSGKNGCFNPMPTNVSQVREEVCLRPDSCDKYPNGQKVTTGKYAGKCLRNHNGMDLAANAGAPVTAAADGYIIKTSSCFGGGGNTIIMKHKKAGGGYYTTTYMHLLKFEKNATKYAGLDHVIPKGSVIGYVGGSGCVNGQLKQNVYGNHLHLELRDGDTGTGSIMSPVCNSVQDLCQGVETTDEEPIQASYTPETSGASATLTGCGKLYSADDLSEFHQRGESKGDAGAFNNCWAKDKGGCSYGVSQMVCYKDSSKWNNSTVANYLRYLQQNDPSKYKALEVGGSLSSTIQAACQSPATEFASKWKALAASDSSFGTSQTQYIEDNYLSYGQGVLQRAGLGALLNRSPEIDMIILAGSVAGAGPMKNNFKAVEKAIAPKTLATATDEEIISAYYDSYAEVMYSSYDPKTAFEKRAAVDKEAALESLAIRKEMENGSSLEEASQKVTGKRACEDNEMPTAKVSSSSKLTLGASVRTPTTSNYTGATSTTSSYNTEKQCNISSYRDSFQSCVFCDIFEILFNTASSVAKKSYNALADGVIILVCVGFALWLGLTVMQFVSAMEQKNPRILVKTILNKAFVILVVVMILRLDSVEFFRLALEPLFNTGFNLAQLVMAGSDGATCNGEYNILLPEEGGGLPSSMGVSILCTIETIQDKLLDIMALGSTSICVAFNIEAYLGIPIFPHLGYLIVGICLWLAAIMLMIIYPFLLIDSVLQLCVATALLPAAVGAYAFKATQKYVGKIWDVFLNCMFNFIFLAIIMFILTNGLIDILADTGITGNQGLATAGTSTSYSVILKDLAWWGVNFLKLVFYMVLGWAVLGEANSFAGSFAKSIGIKSIGANVGGLAASTATKIGVGTVETAYDTSKQIGGAVTERGKEFFNSNIKAPYQQMVANRRANRIANSAATVTDENGNQSLQHRTWYGRKVTDTLQVAPDGSQKVIRTKSNLRGSKATSVENDKFIQNKKTYDKNGNVIREETKMNTAAGKSLLNRDGTRNEVAIHAIKSGSAMSQDDIDKALMQQMMNERLGGVPGADMNAEFKSRSMERSLDDNGREVITVKQLNVDGSSSIFQMIKGEKRDMLSYTHIARNGKAETFASDGIINKKSSFKIDKDGKIDAKTVKNNYAFAKNFNHSNIRSMDSNGKFNKDIPVDQIMMSDADMALFREQIATYGKDTPMSEFGK